MLLVDLKFEFVIYVTLLTFQNMDEQTVVKQEPQEELKDDENVPAFGPAALGLHRVGTKLPPKPTPSQPIQVLNARGMPARIRKKNKFFFDDDIINAKPPRSSPKRGPKLSPIKTPVKNVVQKKRKISPMKKYRIKDEGESIQPASQAPDKKLGQKIGMRLRNLLKLPKAHKWVCYEWFYSNLDKTLFDGDNDFMICLKESFPQLKTHMLTRVEWTKIRRMMGKPRRCSEAFFAEERRELERKRQKIRTLQQRIPGDVANCKDLPDEIPLPLVLGTKVTARLRKPQDGLFTGVIHAVDTSNSTYRITFDRPGLSTYSVPDFEVLSHEPPETISLNSIVQKFRPRIQGSFLTPPSKLLFSNFGPSDSFALSPLKETNLMTEDTLGGFPVKLLENVIRIHKILNVKRMKTRKLCEMNREAERNMSFHGDPPESFRRQYAGILLELEKINKDLTEFLNDVQTTCTEIAPEPGLTAMIAPSYLREKCREEATRMVQQHNSGAPEKAIITNKKYLSVITDLTALMMQIRCLSESDQSPSELQYLKGTVDEIKSKISSANKVTFRNCIEVHLRHIEEGLRSGFTNQYTNKI